MAPCARSAGSSPTLQRKWTKKGDLMAVFILEDLQSSIEVMVFPKTMADIGHKLADDAVHRAEGPGRQARRRAQVHRHGRGGVRRHHRRRPAAAGEGVDHPPRRAGHVDELKAILERFPGESQVFMHLGESKVLRLPDQFCVDTNGGVVAELLVLLGSGAIL
jgi:DNA polymerase-3 subunit alpha